MTELDNLITKLTNKIDALENVLVKRTNEIEIKLNLLLWGVGATFTAVIAPIAIKFLGFFIK